MQIVDVFLYDGEREMLSARLDALDGLVDEHIAVFANRTHQGDVSDVHEPADVRLSGWYEADLTCFDQLGRGGAGTPEYAVRERAHRDSMMTAARWCELEPGDVVLCSDLDEIPSAEGIDGALMAARVVGDDVFVLQQRMHEYALDWLHPQCWLGTMALCIRSDDWPMTPQEARDARGTPRVIEVANGGWHLSWMGGEEMCERKRSRFSHAEELGVDGMGFDFAMQYGFDVNGVALELIEPAQLIWPPGLLERARANPAYWLRP